MRKYIFLIVALSSLGLSITSYVISRNTVEESWQRLETEFQKFHDKNNLMINQQYTELAEDLPQVIENLKTCVGENCTVKNREFIIKLDNLKSRYQFNNCKDHLKMMEQFEDVFYARQYIASTVSPRSKSRLEETQPNYYKIVIEEFAKLSAECKFVFSREDYE